LSRGPPMKISPHEDVLLDAMGAALGALRMELERRMDARFAELEQQIPRFCGVYAAGRTYEPNTPWS
jgi:hypothetical protein